MGENDQVLMAVVVAGAEMLPRTVSTTCGWQERRAWENPEGKHNSQVMQKQKRKTLPMTAQRQKQIVRRSRRRANNSCLIGAREHAGV